MERAGGRNRREGQGGAEERGSGDRHCGGAGRRGRREGQVGGVGERGRKTSQRW